jgi:hypothetical protein
VGQGFADEAAAIDAEMAFDIGLLVFKHGVVLSVGGAAGCLQMGLALQKRAE